MHTKQTGIKTVATNPWIAHCHLADGAWIKCNRIDSKSFALNSSTIYEDGFALEGSVNLHLTHKNIMFLGRINHLQSLGVIFALNESVASSKHVELHLYAVWTQ